MQRDIYGDLQDLFLALGDGTRLRLLAGLAAGPAAVGTLVESVNESQPKVSRHLASLRNLGLVKTERAGKHVYYSIDGPANEPARQIFLGIIETFVAGRGSFPARTAPVPDTNREVLKSEVSPTRSERSEELEIFLL